MIKIKMKVIDEYYYDLDDDWLNTQCKDIKQWCRDTFGKNPRKGPKIWYTSYSCDFNYDKDRWEYIHSFFFTDPKHAQWFALKWL